MPSGKENLRVLEIGVGGGRVALQVAPLLPKGTLTCLDISAEMIKHAKKNLKDLEELGISFVHQTEAERMPVEPRFDFVYSFDVFVHVDIHTLFRTLI